MTVVRTPEGRKKSIYRSEEATDQLHKLIKGFTPEEQAILEEALRDQGMVRTIETKRWRVKPVPMDQFLEDPYYLGESCKSLYPNLKQDLIVFDEGSYRETVLTGGIGVGKTMMCSLIMLRILYRLSCMSDVQGSLGLSKGSEIVMPLISKNLVLAKRVLMSAIVDKVKLSPYFMREFTPRFKTEETIFPNNIQIVIASYGSDKILGTNVIASVFDEANFPPGKRKQVISHSMGVQTTDAHFDIVEKIYTNVLTRIKSRIMMSGGDTPGTMILTSSAGTINSFIDRRVKDAEHDPLCFIRDHVGWTAKPKKNFCGETFRVLCGTSSVQSRILQDDEEVDHMALEKSNAVVINIPTEYRNEFELNLEDSLRDIAGISTMAISAYIQRVEALEECIRYDRKHPCEKLFWTTGTPIPIKWDMLVKTIRKRLGNGTMEESFKPLRNPSAPRWIHIDTSVSGDNTGISVGHISHWVEMEKRMPDGRVITELSPHYVMDLMLGITPAMGEQIFLGDVRQIVYELQNHGFYIMGLSTDGFQCLNGNTLVPTSRGIIELKDVKVGDLVQSRSGPRMVKNVWPFGNRETIKITVEDGHFIEGTKHHKIEVEDYCKHVGDGHRITIWKWKELSEISIGDTIRLWDNESTVNTEYVKFESIDKKTLGWRYCNNRSSIDSFEFPEFLNETLAEWLGIVWADGTMYWDKIIVHGSTEKLHNMIRIFENIFKTTPNVWSSENRCTAQISSAWFSRWLQRVNLYKETKSELSIPEPILKSPNSVQAAFLRGLFSADGHVSENGKVSLSTKWKSFARQIQLLLQMSFGISSRIVVSKRGYVGDYIKTGEQYNLVIRGSRRRFYDLIGLCYDYKRKRLEDNINRPGRNMRVSVVKIEESRGDVFDLEVDQDPSYVANGFISHNSADLRQQVQRTSGIQCALQSVDTTTMPYDALKAAIYEKRIEFYDYPPLFEELRALEYDRERGKIDHPRAGCFSGETRVPLLDGTCPMISELSGKDCWVYSARNDGTIVPGKARGRLSKYVTKMLDIVLDSGAVVRCTPEHLWMLKNGTYKEAQLLVPGVDRLMPLNRIWPVNGGYERVTDTNGKRTLTHHIVSEFFEGQLKDGHVVHHKNKNPIDNIPENIEMICKKEHSKKHTIDRYKIDPNYRTKVREGLQRFNLSDHGRKVHSDAFKRTLSNRTVEQCKESAKKRKNFRSDVEFKDLEALLTNFSIDNANVASRQLKCGRNVIMRILRNNGFISWEDFAKNHGTNHKVRYVYEVTLNDSIPVYDLEVDEWNNFGLSAGVFVHNSKDLSDSVASVIFCLSQRISEMPLERRLFDVQEEVDPAAMVQQQIFQGQTNRRVDNPEELIARREFEEMDGHFPMPFI